VYIKDGLFNKRRQGCEWRVRQADSFPELAQPLYLAIGRVAGDHGSVQSANGYTRQSVEGNARFLQAFEHTGLISAQCATTLQNKRHGFVGWKLQYACHAYTLRRTRKQDD